MITLGITNIVKRYGTHLALGGVTAEIRGGRITALVGGNGAGKSTLIKILAGAMSPDRGSMHLGGTELRMRSTRDARRLGVAAIHQEQSLIESWQVWEHFVDMRDRIGSRRSAARARAAKILASMNAEIDVDHRIGDLSINARQAIEIAKALAQDPRVLLLDEPMTGLDPARRAWLLSKLRERARQGIIIIIVSHDLPSMLRDADDLLLLRDGKITVSGPTNTLTLDDLGFGPLPRAPSTIRTGSQNGAYDVDMDITLRSGERIRGAFRPGDIVGILHSPRSEAAEMLRVICGLEPSRDRRITVCGHEVPASPWRCVRHNVFYVSRERGSEWLFYNHSVERNLNAASFRLLRNRWTVVDRAAERANAEDLRRRFEIVAGDLSEAVETLSGGNQQKTVVARAISVTPHLLLLDEPFSGVDVKTRATLIGMLSAIAVSGAILIVFSREAAEIAALANRWAYFPGDDAEAKWVEGALSEGEVQAGQQGVYGNTERGDACVH